MVHGCFGWISSLEFLNLEPLRWVSLETLTHSKTCCASVVLPPLTFLTCSVRHEGIAVLCCVVVWAAVAGSAFDNWNTYQEKGKKFLIGSRFSHVSVQVIYYLRTHHTLVTHVFAANSSLLTGWCDLQIASRLRILSWGGWLLTQAQSDHPLCTSFRFPPRTSKNIKC